MREDSESWKWFTEAIHRQQTKIFGLDECHQAKSSGSHRGKTIRRLVDHTRGEHVMLLSATPGPNRYHDFGMIFHMLNPEKYPSPEMFSYSGPEIIKELLEQQVWFRLTREQMKDELGSFLPDMTFKFNYINNKPIFNRATDDFGIDVTYNKDGFSKSREVVWEGEGDGLKEFNHYGIDAITSAVDPQDFRLYIHRMIELFFEVPRKKWHSPSIYSSHPHTTDMKQLESVLDATLPLLFSGTEQTEFANRIQEAKLRMRNGYASVPTLNLGALQMPTPGQRNVMNDQFVMTGATYLVEVLSHYGQMPRDEALQTMTQKLTNYFMGRFQVSRESARQVIKSLSGNVSQLEKIA
ncbi:MAG: SNF2-related domain [archaeon]|jgi:hypothetical protein